MGKKEEILTLANETLQQKGLASISFRELAKALGIKSSSIHYYFAQKNDLVDQIAKDYINNLFAQLAEETGNLVKPHEKLLKTLEIIEGQLEARLCTCGMLAAESEHLSDTTKERLVKFFSDVSAFFSGIIQEIGYEKSKADNLGAILISAIEGALLIDSIERQLQYFNEVKVFVKYL